MMIPLHTSTRRWSAARTRVLKVAATVRELLNELAGCWRHALAREQFADMDDRTLRDLGVHRSEISSYFAESNGGAELTRRRIALLIDGSVGR